MHNYDFLYVGKEMYDHLVEWVDKISRARVNKLFEIDQVKRKCLVLLREKIWSLY